MYSISDLSHAFGVTPRTIRYYEELGLLKPSRNKGNLRIYGKKEHAQLRLILRGKRYGFSLEEIKEMVLLFDSDRTGEQQLIRTLEYGSEKISEINARMKELEEMKKEMAQLMDLFTNKLKELKGRK